MSDTPPEGHFHSQTNLIEVQHVGVTAKLQSPLKDLLLNYSSSTENERRDSIYQQPKNSSSKYNKFTNEAGTGTTSDSTLTDSSKILYEMKAIPNQGKKVGEMKNSKVKPPPSPIDKIFDNLPEPNFQTSEIRIGIYPFDHGNADYLQTHERPPHVHSLALAQRTTDYATKFWAEFFGSLHIGVAFVVTFLLQSYRFILYSLVNTLMVGLLHMTSDYLLKPLLTVAFNGFLQPPMIFCFNTLSSMRDILEPIADTLNNFAKPIATVGRSVRLKFYN
uniref:Uncharacterized protein n=1 Tax=Musca domestica TaxID=7370 RepID=A0A1I8N4H7_MUSDO